MQVLKIFVVNGLLALAVACGSSVNAASGVNTSPDSASANSRAISSFGEIVFSGGQGMHQVNGDKVVVKDGILRVNGVSYGTVNGTSVVKYTVRDNTKTVTVDGTVRQPVR